MARKLQDISLDQLSKNLRSAREKKGWTLEELSHELWQQGFPTSQNKLWRMENKPPKRVDTELLLWLEKVLDVELIEAEEKKQVLMDDVIELLDAFVVARRKDNPLPKMPENKTLREIYKRAKQLAS
ncbi:MAG: helix-turn-helix transcriptional regulator [Verrucomicrobiota bacterium]